MNEGGKRKWELGFNFGFLSFKESRGEAIGIEDRIKADRLVLAEFLRLIPSETVYNIGTVYLAMDDPYAILNPIIGAINGIDNPENEFLDEDLENLRKETIKMCKYIINEYIYKYINIRRKNGMDEFNNNFHRFRNPLDKIEFDRIRKAKSDHNFKQLMNSIHNNTVDYICSWDSTRKLHALLVREARQRLGA